MKRYYVSFKGHGFMIILFTAMCIVNSVLFFIIGFEHIRFIDKVNLFSSIFWFIIGLISISRVYKIFTKKIYFEINEQNLYYIYFGKGKIFEYADADSYTAKQAHGGFIIYYESLADGTKKVVPLNTYNVDYKEFFKLLNEYSGKDIFIKEYGEELKLFQIND